MLSFDDFLKVFDAYGKYIAQSPAAQAAPTAQAAQAAQAAPAAPAAPTAQAAPAAPTAQAAPAAPAAPAAQDGITQMLTQMQAQLNQMQTPAPTINTVKPVSVDDVIAKIFE